MRAPLKIAMVNWAPSLNIIIIFIMIMMMMMIMVMVMMHNVWYRRKAIDEAFEISFNKTTILQEKITQRSNWFQNQNIESSVKVTE